MKLYLNNIFDLVDIIYYPETKQIFFSNNNIRYERKAKVFKDCVTIRFKKRDYSTKIKNFEKKPNYKEGFKRGNMVKEEEL